MEANPIRDVRKVRELREHGFNVITLWECQAFAQKMARLRKFESHLAL